MHRDVSPLKQADDAVYVDTSDMTVEQVIEKIIEICETTRRN
jgi:cytidylate kinase